MASLATNVRQAIADFRSIAEAIGDKGVNIPANTPTSRYADLIRQTIDSEIYGVSGLFDESTSLVRTDDAVGMSFSVNAENGTVTSDFNSVFPWNETQLVNDAAGKFVSFPRMFFRVGCDSESRLTDIAVSKYPSGEGSWYKVEPFMIARYGGSLSSDKLVSVSSAQRAASLTRAEFRGYCRENGSSYALLDLYHRTALMFLFYIEFAVKNSESVMTGVKSGSSAQSTGGTDSLTTPSGFNTTTKQMRYHYIEDVVGNLREFVDGVCGAMTGQYDYVSSDPDVYSDDRQGKTALRYTSAPDGTLKALGWDDNNPFCCMPLLTESGIGYSTYFCDRASRTNDNTEYPVIVCGTSYNDQYGGNGLSYFSRYLTSGKGASIGGRLIKLL